MLLLSSDSQSRPKTDCDGVDIDLALSRYIVYSDASAAYIRMFQDCLHLFPGMA